MIKQFIFGLLLFATALVAQQPQANDIPPTQPIFATNAKLVNGVAPGYWPTAPSVTGLTLNISAGTVNCKGSILTQTSTTQTMANNTTNYVYLDGNASCVVSSGTSAFTTSQIPIAIVTTSGGNITAISDVRTMMYLAASGASSSCGSVSGDDTSTDCGFQNRVGDTASIPANVSTYGFTNLAVNAATDVVSVGDTNGKNNTGQFGVMIGDNNGGVNSADVCPINEAILMGDSNFSQCFGGGMASLIAIGDNNGRFTPSANTITSGGLIMIGEGNVSNTIDGSFLGPVITIGYSNLRYSRGATDVIAIGDVAGDGAVPGGSRFTDIIAIGDASGDPPDNSRDVIAIGNGTGDTSDSYVGALTTSFSVFLGSGSGDGVAGSDNISLGDNTGTAFGGTTTPQDVHDNIGIGNHALACLTTGGDDNIGIGDYAGSNGYVDVFTCGNSNKTGSHNVWIGDLAGPATTTQLDDTIAIGFNSVPTQSHEAVIGGTTTTLVLLKGAVEVNGGTNVVFRCTGASTLPVGALTTDSTKCSTSSDTGLRVQ